jgi:hypothetical protein
MEFFLSLPLYGDVKVVSFQKSEKNKKVHTTFMAENTRQGCEV